MNNEEFSNSLKLLGIEVFKRIKYRHIRRES